MCLLSLVGKDRHVSAKQQPLRLQVCDCLSELSVLVHGSGLGRNEDMSEAERQPQTFPFSTPHEFSRAIRLRFVIVYTIAEKPRYVNGFREHRHR
jgi:hypothetical protein